MLQNYAFVQFESEKDAQAVLETYENQPLLGKNVVIEFAHPLRKDMPSVRSSNSFDTVQSPPRPFLRYPVVVMNIPRDIRWQELKDFGRLSGKLVAYCDLDKTQRGRGFVEYFTREDAELAVSILDGKRLGGRRVRVVTHESMGRSSTRSWERVRSRSRSPERAPVSHRPRQRDRQYDRKLSAHTSYADPQTPPIHHNRDITPYSVWAQPHHHCDYTYRAPVNNLNWDNGNGGVTSWSSHREYQHTYPESTGHQYPDEGIHVLNNPGYPWNTMHRDYDSSSVMDPYQ
ncbi:hypothetical protein B0H34DRAFT_689221 [Crassisporium funariophilum]|nr:hypothetical protein B0H34DRAFT_689221 [Crassisporium funariophilum]